MTLKDAKITEMTLSDLIRLLREAAILIIAGVITTKLLTGGLGLDFAKLSASELVSILLAFFSIALSASFYFAATNQSNQFYDNVNNFTKDTSTLLGRLDEQVKGIGGRQTELKDSLDKYYFTGGGERAEKSNVKKAQEETEKQVEQVKSDLSSIVSELYDKARLSPEERENFESRIKERDIELDQLRERLERLSSRSERPMRNHTRQQLKQMGLHEAIKHDPAELLLLIAQKSFDLYRRDLFNLGYTTTKQPTSREDITDEGVEMIRRELEKAFDKDA